MKNGPLEKGLLGGRGINVDVKARSPPLSACASLSHGELLWQSKADVVFKIFQNYHGVRIEDEDVLARMMNRR